MGFATHPHVNRTVDMRRAETHVGSLDADIVHNSQLWGRCAGMLVPSKPYLVGVRHHIATHVVVRPVNHHTDVPKRVATRTRRSGSITVTRAESDVDCSISPNPAPGIGVLSIDLVEGGDLVVTFFGADGRQALRRNPGHLSRGSQTILVDFTDLDPGANLIEVAVDGRHYGSTIVINR